MKKDKELIDNFRQNVKRIRLCCDKIEWRRYQDTPMIRAMAQIIQETIKDMLSNVDKYTDWLLNEHE